MLYIFFNKQLICFVLKSETVSEQILLIIWYISLFIGWKVVAWPRGQCTVCRVSVFRSMETTIIHYNRHHSCNFWLQAKDSGEGHSICFRFAYGSVHHFKPFQEAFEYCSSIKFMFNNPQDTVHIEIYYKHTLYTMILIWLYKAVFLYTYSPGIMIRLFWSELCLLISPYWLDVVFLFEC